MGNPCPSLGWSLAYARLLGFPCSSVGKESACNVGDLSLIPGSGRSLEKKLLAPHWLPTPVFLPGKSHGQRRSLAGYHKESDMTEQLHFHFHIKWCAWRRIVGVLLSDHLHSEGNVFLLPGLRCVNSDKAWHGNGIFIFCKVHVRSYHYQAFAFHWYSLCLSILFRQSHPIRSVPRTCIFTR